MQTQLQFLADCNRKTDRELMAILEQLDPALSTRATGAYYGSILGTLSHVLLADLVWAERLIAFEPGLGRVVGTLPERGPPAVIDRVWSSLSGFRAARERADDGYVEVTAALSDEHLGRTMHYRNLKGEPQSKPVWVVLLHLFTHQIHHRGQVAALLDQAGVANDYSALVTKYG